MTLPETDPCRFLSHEEAAREHDDLFADFYEKTDDSATVAGLRRRRRRVGNGPESPMKAVSLIEEDGVLYWRDGIPARAPDLRRRGRHRGIEPEAVEPEAKGSVVFTREFPVIAPNKVI